MPLKKQWNAKSKQGRSDPPARRTTRARRPAEHTGPNWLELLEDPAPHQILVRRTFMSRASEAI